MRWGDDLKKQDGYIGNAQGKTETNGDRRGKHMFNVGRHKKPTKKEDTNVHQLVLNLQIGFKKG